MMDRVKLAVGLLVALQVLGLGAPDAHAERAVAAEARLGDLLRAEAARHSVLLRQEEELQQAARALAQCALDGATGRAVARTVLWDHDVRDAEFDAFVLLGKRAPDDTATSLLLGSSVDWTRARVGAVGVVTHKRRTAVAFVLVRRVARFRGGGAVALPTGALPRLVVTDPTGQVHVRRLQRHPVRPDSWSFDPSTPDLAGRWLFELEVQQGGGTSLAAIWPATARGSVVAPPQRSVPSPDDPLGVGPRGLGAGGEAVADPTSLEWTIGAERAPLRDPAPADAAALEQYLWSLLGARRRVARQPAPRRWPALTSTARDGASAVVNGERPGRLVGRLMEREVAALKAEEHLLVAGSPHIAWALLVSEPASRAAIVGGQRLGSVGAVLQSDGPGNWSVGLSLVLAEGRIDAGGSWHDLVLAHVQAERDAARLPRFASRDPLNEIAQRTARHIAAAGELDLSDEARAALIAEIRGNREILGVGVDVMITNDVNRVAEREHTRDPSYSEIGLGVSRPPGRINGQPEGTLVLVLVFVQR
jgi:hypothetical protein